MKVIFNSSIATILSILSGIATAGTLEIGPVYLDSVSIIGPSAFGHQAGNMEIRIANGTGNPAAVVCDQTYVTTKNSVPNFNQMVTVLLAAQIAQKPVRLGITDDPSLTAFSGRCSLVSVGIVK